MRLYPLLLISLLLLFSACEKKRVPVTASCLDIHKSRSDDHSHTAQKKELTSLQHQYDECGTVKCCELYIENVIAEGSAVLGLPAGVMDGGYATPKDAKKIAAYVMTLSGKSPSHPNYVEDGNLYYNGNCGGCHGDDGKGLGGTYPDLTLPLLKGAGLLKGKIAKDITSLKAKLKQ